MGSDGQLSKSVLYTALAAGLFGCASAPSVATDNFAHARLNVDVHWRGNGVTAESTLQRDVEVNAAHEFVLNESDYLATGRLDDAVPLVLAGQQALTCWRPVIASFVDTETEELREPLGSRGAVMCRWPGVTGRHAVTIIAHSALGAQAHYIVTTAQNAARIQARYHVPTALLGTAAQPMRGTLSLWYWGTHPSLHQDFFGPERTSNQATSDANGVGQAMLEHAALVDFRGGVVLVERTATVATARHLSVHDDSERDAETPLPVTDELELAALPMPIMPGSLLTLRLADGKEQVLRGAAIEHNRFIVATNTAVDVVKTAQDYRVRGGRARSHKYVLHNHSATALVVECWEPVPATQLGFWHAPNATIGAATQRDGWLITPVTVPANSETWIARGWRTP